MSARRVIQLGELNLGKNDLFVQMRKAAEAKPH